MGDEPAAKITDPALLATMAAGDDARPVSVVIEAVPGGGAGRDAGLAGGGQRLRRLHTGTQLQEIARSPLVKAIHPTRRLGS